MLLARILTTSSICLLASSLAPGCDSVPESKRVEPAEPVRVPSQIPPLPYKSVKCGPDELALEGECITEERAQEVVEEISDAAVKQMIRVHDNPEAQVEAQQILTKIQAQRVEQQIQETKEIKEIIEAKKEAGKPLGKKKTKKGRNR